jgi:hypothetical protein
MAVSKILTKDHLKKQHIIVVDRCCMCKRNEKSMDHLLLHCDMPWVISRRIVNLYACWWSSSSLRSAAMWKMVPTCLLWCLWRKINDINFEDRERTLEEIKALFFKTLYL